VLLLSLLLLLAFAQAQLLGGGTQEEGGSRPECAQRIEHLHTKHGARRCLCGSLAAAVTAEAA
jgi:hypothetical protein